MAGEKYVIATGENSMQIEIRNMLNPFGYIFLGNCSDAISLMRLIRSYNPDFVIVDLNMQLAELKRTIETIDDEMLCTCILVGHIKDMELADIIEKSKALSFCPKPISRELLAHTIELANMFAKRINRMDKKLKEMTENLETRKAVEKAKWILIKKHGINEDEAYERMRKKSMDTRMTMKAIAEAVIFTHEISEKK